jgi:hypothetical protein
VAEEGIENSVTPPALLIRPIRSAPASVNQRLPSLPREIDSGRLPEEIA